MSEFTPPLQKSGFSTDAYGASYYLDPNGQPQGTFAFNEQLTLSRAQAIANTADVPPGGRILDYGGGLGALTLAFNRLGYEAVGIDPSPHAIEHALPEAQAFVQPLGQQVMADLVTGDTFDLVVAKDVFEHIPERELHDVADHLLTIGEQVMAIIPLVGADRKFLFSLYESDPTHITRLTRDEWLGFFPYTVVEDRQDLTPLIRRSDKVDSTLCLQLAEPDPQRRQMLEWPRDIYKLPTWRRKLVQLLGGAR